jgi:pimeloyl-ACP methyl ester carboxylesterase
MHQRVSRIYRIEKLVDDLTGLIRALGGKRAVVVGHDWGGAVAWATALIRADVGRAAARDELPASGKVYRPRPFESAPEDAELVDGVLPVAVYRGRTAQDARGRRWSRA